MWTLCRSTVKHGGVLLSLSTLGGWVRLLSEELALLPEALHKEVVQCDYLQVDSHAGSQKEREGPPGLSLGVPAPRSELLYVDL